MKRARKMTQDKPRFGGPVWMALRWLAGPFIIIIYTVSMMVEKLRF